MGGAVGVDPSLGAGGDWSVGAEPPTDIHTQTICMPSEN